MPTTVTSPWRARADGSRMSTRWVEGTAMDPFTDGPARLTAVGVAEDTGER